MRAAVVMLLACTLVLGLAYPLAMTGAAQLAYPAKADGEARLIARPQPRDLFQPRPSATGYATDPTAFNNLGPNQRDLAAQLRKAVRAYLRRERPSMPGLTAARIPVDAVTSSASGVDPDISEANALIQARRVAKLRGLPLGRVQALVREHVSHGAVNVNDLNRAVRR
jgi:K+-transporting ATPase ATPase C chain